MVARHSKTVLETVRWSDCPPVVLRCEFDSDWLAWSYPLDDSFRALFFGQTPKLNVLLRREPTCFPALVEPRSSATCHQRSINFQNCRYPIRLRSAGHSQRELNNPDAFTARPVRTVCNVVDQTFLELFGMAIKPSLPYSFCFH